ncbi:MAG: cytochrome c [Bacteroidota bacterium]|nr:cytochrome c [Bacteroidota bacterium]
MKLLAALLLLPALYVTSPEQGPASSLKASVERGSKVYQTICLTCHQADGLGVDRMNPPLVKTKWVLGDKKALAKIVLNGLKGGEIQIDGDEFHNPMPPQATQLSDQQIADVLTFVRNSFGNKASAVSPAEVKAVRKAIGAPAGPASPAAPVKKAPVKKAPVKK